MYNLNSFKKKYIFKNLSLNTEKFKLDNEYNKVFRIYKNNTFFFLGKKIFFLLKKTNGSEILFTKFIATFLRMYYKQRKSLNKFIHFLNLLLLFLYKFKIVSGIRIQMKGRLRGTPRSKKYVFQQGQIPTQTIALPISYTFIPLYTRYGVVGLKVWIYQ